MTDERRKETDRGSKSKLIRFEQGTVILSEGDNDRDMYKIIRGHAEVYVGYKTGQETLIGIIGPQSIFGEYGLLLKKPAIYTVVAYDEVCVMRITESELGAFVGENHKNIIDIMRNMANMMQTMRMQINLILDDLENGRKPSVQTVRDLRRAMRGYAIYDAQTVHHMTRR